MKDLIIIGAGDFGREVTSVVERINGNRYEWNLLGFADDNKELAGKIIDGYKVLGDTKWLQDYKKEVYAVCSLGDSVTRKRVLDRFKGCDNIKYATLVDPDVITMRNVEIKEGSIVCAGSVLAIDLKVGRHSIINVNCTIGHDTITGNYFTSHAGTNISGKVVIGDKVYFGAGSKVIQGITIAADSFFGAGAVVVKDVKEPGTYAGVPAVRIKK